METVASIFMKVRALLDEYTDDGVFIPEDEVIDMQRKSIPLVDMAQKELYKIGKLYKTFEMTRKPYVNELGLISNFNIEDYEGTEQYYPKDGVNGKAYFFEVDGEGTVLIQENNNGWQTIEQIDFDTDKMTSFKGLIDSNHKVRMVFTGDYHYRHTNRAIFNYPFTVDKIPDYKPWVQVELPDDFRTLDQVVTEYPERQYSQDTNYKWEGYKTFIVNYYYDGLIRIIYKPIPTTITELDDVLEVDDITAQAIVYYVAARLAPFENKELVQFFESKYMELKAENTHDKPMSEELIMDMYRSGY